MVVVCWWTAPSTKSARCPDSCSLRLLRELCIGVMMEARRPLSWRSAIADADGSTCHGGWAGAGGARSCLRCPLPSSPAAADARAVASKRAMTDVTAPTASSLNSSGARRTSARAVVRAPALFVGQSAGWRKGIRDHSPPPAPGRPRNLASSGRGVARVQRCACRVREEQRCKGRGRRHVPRRRVCRRGHVRARRRTSRACGKKLDQSHTSWPLDDRAEGKKISKRPYWGSNPDCMIAGS